MSALRGNSSQYKNFVWNSERWNGFAFRDGDIVISTPPKCGTTWMQMQCAVLLFRTPDLPAPLSQLSPWMDMNTRPLAEVHADLEAQTHRRFIKTHTPLDGVPIVDEVRYLCVGRDPRDAAISMLHHADNMDRIAFARLLTADARPGDEPPKPRPDLTFEERIDRFIDGDDFPGWNLRFLAHHYMTFWEQRGRENVALFHFDDYRRGLPAEIQRMAAHLEIEVSPERAAELADETDIERVRSRAADVAPEAHLGVWKDTTRFFRSGKSRQWEDEFTAEQQERYEALVAELVPEDLAAWMHGGWAGVGRVTGGT